MKPAVAFVVLAHSDPPQVRRLLTALRGADVFLHCDKRTPRAVAAEMLIDADPGVHAVQRRRTSTFSWSLVGAELDSLRLALEHTEAQHIVVMSGSCYPLVSVRELEDQLVNWRGRSRLELNPFPYRHWHGPFSSDGGTWRLAHRFLTTGDQLVIVRDTPIPIHRRPIPAELRLHATAHWKIYARHHAEALLSVFADDPQQLKFWRTTYCPEESCVASILKSPDLVGSIADEVINDLPWFIKWPELEPKHHPRWLDASDLAELRAARFAPPRDPDAVISPEDRWRYGKLFARKLRSSSAPLLAEIDRELRNDEVPAALEPR
jgi:Core-2/I-Branching enzyme